MGKQVLAVPSIGSLLADLDKILDRLETLESPAAKGEGKGHQFRGNQWTGGIGAADPQGSLPHRREIVDAALAMHAHAMKIEPKLTKHLQDIAKREGAKLVKVDKAVKTTKSMADKVARKWKEMEDWGVHPSLDGVRHHIFDANRYTMLIKSGDYKSTIQQTVHDLEDQGYRFDDRRWKNTWGSGDYRAINTTVQSPNGDFFELQFHTPESLDVKNANHGDYKIAQDEDTSAAKRAEIYQRMLDRADTIPTPPGVSDLSKPPHAE